MLWRLYDYDYFVLVFSDSYIDGLRNGYITKNAGEVSGKGE